MRSCASGTLIGLATVVILAVAAVVSSALGALPTWAGEAENSLARELDARWRSFAADLASASGCAVRYESTFRGGSDEFSREMGAWDDHGVVGMLRIGAADGPAVLLMPEGFLNCTETSQAYDRAGLHEPRRFAQELVASAAFSAPAEGGNGRSLADLLKTRSVLIPVGLVEGTRRGRSARGRFREGEPSRNFPVRWEEAARLEPGAAGPYPASHPGVRALTSWLNSTPDCAVLLRVAPKAGTGPTLPSFGAGTLGAFCSEVLGISVRDCTPLDCFKAIEDSLRECGELSFTDLEWTRLGSMNWALEVTVERVGGVPGTVQPVLLTASPVGGGMSLTAAAASSGLGDGATMELLPLRKQGLLLEAVGTGEKHRVRLFLSGGASKAGSGSHPRDGAAELGQPFRVLLTATSARVQRASIRAKSPL